MSKKSRIVSFGVQSLCHTFMRNTSRRFFSMIGEVTWPELKLTMLAILKDLLHNLQYVKYSSFGQPSHLMLTLKRCFYENNLKFLWESSSSTRAGQCIVKYRCVAVIAASMLQLAVLSIHYRFCCNRNFWCITMYQILMHHDAL